MTEQEFLALPDREKDAIVAEKVMGWTKVEYFPNDDCGPRSDCANGLRPDGAYTAVPCYFTDIAAAWQVIAQMQATGHIANTEIDAGSGFTIGYSDLDGNEYGFHTVLLVNRAPLAICMAALDAKGFFDSKGATA